ncbi:MAG: response regulator [Thermodesulfobacteriota bacterium]
MKMAADRARVLIVEDEAILAANLEDQVREMGHEVVGVTGSGERAVRLCLGEMPDLVLMDIRLEGEMDGLEAAQRIRESHPVAVVFITTYSDEPFLERAKSSEPFGYLVKPVAARELRATLEMAIYKGRMDRERTTLIARLQEAMANVRELSGLLPICSGCKKIRNDEGYWSQVEEFISKRSDVRFTHSLCPECAHRLYPDLYPKEEA